jgi:hypothetical protein
MPQLQMEVPHTLGQEEATKRLKDKFGLAKQMYQQHVSDLREEWTDHTLAFGFRAVGMAVPGTLAVEPSAVRIVAELPWAAMLAKGMIEQRIRQELGQILA